MPISIAKVSLARVDALSVYTLVLAQCLALQVVKDAQTLTWHVTGARRALPTVALALAVLRAHARPGDTRSTLALATAGLLALTVNGSQSNHVLLELALCAATLLAAPAGCFSRAEARRGAARRAFSRNLTDSTRALLAALYLCTGFAKLNDDWHDPNQSCCVQMFVGALAGCGLAPATAAALAPAAARKLMPFGATAFELAFGFALALGLARRAIHHARGPGDRTDGDETVASVERDPAHARTLAVFGAAFHALIALPPPPMSVYPFSMLMAPPYVAGLVPHSVTSAARAFARCQDEVKIASAVFLAAALAHARQTAREKDAGLFEYPAYFAWRVGVAWTVVAFGGVAFAARRGVVPVGARDDDGAAARDAVPASADEHERRSAPSAGTRASALGRRVRLALPALFVATAAAAPYLGARTHPAFAMFSNLRVEGGGETNHWIVRRVSPFVSPSNAVNDAYDAYARAYGPDVAVRVEATNLPSLRDFQINLAPLFPESVRESLRLTDVAPEFLIAPPAWGPRLENPEAPRLGSRARPLTLPLAEARRRVTAALRAGEKASGGASFFVKFRWVVGGVAESRATEFRVKNGSVARSVKGRDAVLGAPLPWWRALVHRYRAFDLDASPCRH